MSRSAEISQSLNDILGTGDIDFTNPSEEELELMLEILAAWKENMTIDPAVIISTLREQFGQILDERAERIKNKLSERSQEFIGRERSKKGLVEEIIDEVLAPRESGKKTEKKGKNGR
jgi:hypothetical protein